MTLGEEIKRTFAMIDPIRADRESEWWRDEDGRLHHLYEDDAPRTVIRLPPSNADALRRIEKDARETARRILEQESSAISAGDLRFVWRTGERCRACDADHNELRPPADADGTPVEYCVDPADDYSEIDWERDAAVAFDQDGAILTDGHNRGRRTGRTDG